MRSYPQENNIFVRDCCEKERAFRGRLITQLPAGSRLSVIELRKRRSRSSVMRIRGLTETG